ncbi:MAG: ATP-dependent 6-phosphofructokinase [Candidatus Cloacimonadota bacterium]|nr:ATP-dependent 6-phosphofructokinase [Candidatus Cloacimonadota bacterium]
MKKRCLVATGGGDCPGLNAVIRAIVKRASQERGWEIIGSIDAFNGILKEPMEIRLLDKKAVAGIHVRGGTIIGTTNKGGPFAWPVKDKDGNWTAVDRSEEMLRKLRYNNIEAVINIGGDGSQLISQRLYEMGCNIIGVPKTIDNDLSGTDYTFGFQTAVEVATEAVDKLVTTAESHHRIIILEVMGRSAGWIALHSALAGGAEVCLIPEIPYNINKVKECVERRTEDRRGFANIVIAEGAYPQGGSAVYQESDEVGYENVMLGGTSIRLMHELKKSGVEADIRVTILGHLQRGGIPCAFDRILATQFGVKAFEMVLEKKFGYMAAFKHPDIVAVPIKDAISKYNFVSVKSNLVHTAKGVGISFGD